MLTKTKNLLSKILVVDDDGAFFQVLKRGLAREKVFLMWAKDGEEGIQKAKIELPDLVITDIVMPKLNGFEVIKALKEKALTADIRVVVLSNYGETPLLYDSAFLESLGIAKYLVKSNYSPVELVREIRAVLE